jgi:hypothetical protein
MEAQWINCRQIVRVTQSDAGIVGDEIVADAHATMGTHRVIYMAGPLGNSRSHRRRPTRQPQIALTHRYRRALGVIRLQARVSSRASGNGASSSCRRRSPRHHVRRLRGRPNVGTHSRPHIQEIGVLAIGEARRQLA